jgi:hypothetical protein
MSLLADVEAVMLLTDPPRPSDDEDDDEDDDESDDDAESWSVLPDADAEDDDEPYVPWVVSLNEDDDDEHPVDEDPIAERVAMSLGLIPAPDRRHLLVTANARDDVRATADWHRLVVEMAPLDERWLAVRRITDDSDELDPMPWFDAVLVSTMGSRKVRTLELWEQGGVGGIVLWHGSEPRSAVRWGLHRELVMPAGWSTEVPTTLDQVDESVTVMQAELDRMGHAIDVVNLRALARRRELSPAEALPRALEAFRLPPTAAELVSDEIELEDLPGYECFAGSGQRAAMHRVLSAPAPARTPRIFRIGFTLPLWYRIACAFVGVLMTIGFIVRVFGSGGDTGTRLVGIGQGVVALVCWIAVFSPSARSDDDR